MESLNILFTGKDQVEVDRRHHTHDGSGDRSSDEIVFAAWESIEDRLRNGAVWSTSSGPLECPIHAGIPILPMLQNVLREHPRRLHINRIVQQHQRLQRRIGALSLDRALFVRRRVERQQAGVQVRPRPIGI